MSKTFKTLISRATAVVLALATVTWLGGPFAQAQTTLVGPGANPAAGSSLSEAASEVVKLASAGTSDDVILAYIQNVQSPFALSAANVIYLKDLGVSSQVVAAMLNRDQALRTQTPSPYAPTAVAPTPDTTTPPPAAPAEYVSTAPPDVAYFYNDLSPYGAWIELPGYGWCWQPTVVVVNRGWRPYCDGGHWIFSDAGWYWVSDYSWGWGPFHYGRWYNDARCGWVWMPDRVWGPAWVTWRVAGDHCGWAPVPPHATFDVRLGWCFNGVRVGLNFDFGLHPDVFTFVSYGHFCDHDLHHRCLAPTEVTHIYKQTTIINNYTVQNNIIVNQGVKVDRVAAATHTQIHKAVIRDLPAGSAGIAQAHGWEKSGNVVYRPQLKAPTKPVNMVAQKVDEHHPVIQHPVQRAPIGTTGTERISSLNRVNPPGNNVQVPHSTAPPSPTPTYRAQPQTTVGNPPQQSGQQHSAVPKTWVAPQGNQQTPETKPHTATAQPVTTPQQPKQDAHNLEETKQVPHPVVQTAENVNSGSVQPSHQPELQHETPREQNPQSYSKPPHQVETHSQQPSNPHQNQQGQGQSNGKKDS